jgi:hypothetical protein
MEDLLYVFKDFVNQTIISVGPLKAFFEFSYAPWKAGDALINEAKRISLELGSQLYHMEDQLQANKKIPNVTTAITRHEGEGKTTINEKSGWYSYWETIDDADLGTGIVVDPKDTKRVNEHRTMKKKRSHLYIHLKANYFLERRELGIINVGGTGDVIADGTTYTLKNKETLYLGLGTKSVSFKKSSSDQKPHFYFNSAPAHAAHPSKRVTEKEVEIVEIGSLEQSNHRVFRKLLVNSVVETYQLQTGLTALKVGSVWNTLPCHTHDRRMEA